MRICIIHSSDLRKRGGHSTSFLGFFNGCEVYIAELFRNFSRRSLRRLINDLKSLRVSFVALCDSLAPLKNSFLKCGITPVFGDCAYSSQIAEMALLFAEKRNLPKRFLIRGGSFYTASQIALKLLCETNDVFLDSPDFDEISEVCADFCGAVIRKTPSANPIVISPLGKDFLFFANETLSFPDFYISPSPPPDFFVPASCAAALSSCLKICGFLGDNDLKCELLSK